MRGAAFAVLRRRVPEELAELVCQCAAASTIARAVRRSFMRHARRPVWGRLRAALVCTDSSAFARLTLNAGVRREWRLEPESWLTALAVTPRLLRMLADEVDDGLWPVTA